MWAMKENLKIGANSQPLKLKFYQKHNYSPPKPYQIIHTFFTFFFLIFLKKAA